MTESRFSDHSRQVISEATTDALARLKASGVRLGPPRLTPDEVVERVVRERDAGRGWQRIADGLAADGVPTVRGGTWRVSTVQRVYHGHRLDQEAAVARVTDDPIRLAVEARARFARRTWRDDPAIQFGNGLCFGVAIGVLIGWAYL